MINGLFAALPFFDNRSDAAADPEYTVINEDGSQLTGVAKYLAKQPSPTGVDKYLSTQSNEPATGVARYMAHQSISDNAKPALTSVDKYIIRAESNANQADPITGVRKYLAHQILVQPLPKQTGVAEYINKQQAAAELAGPKTGVERYLAGIDLAERKVAAAELVAKYIKQEELAAELAAIKAESERRQDELDNETDEPSGTAVSKYLSTKQNRSPTGVAKYVAKLVIEEKNQPARTGVERYVIRQVLADKQRPALTGVTKYLIKLKLQAWESPVLTGVTKYVDKHSRSANLPATSGVAKYLAKQLVEDQGKLAEKASPTILEAQVISENETIAVTEVEVFDDQQKPEAVTGVAKYLAEQEIQHRVTGVAKYIKSKAKIEQNDEPESGVTKYMEKQTDLSNKDSNTGVAKYLANKMKKDQEIAEANATGVEKYLRNNNK